MITSEQQERVRGLVRRSTPAGVAAGARPEVAVDRDEVTVVLTVPDVELPTGTPDPPAAARRGARRRASAFREETREQRMEIAREAEHRFERKVSWGLVVGERTRCCGPTSPPR